MRRLVTCFTFLLLPACGDDSGGSADAPPPDAPPIPDANTTDTTGGGGAYQIVTCEGTGPDAAPGTPDAPPAVDADPLAPDAPPPVDAGPTPDAPATTADAGTTLPPGFNDPCCSDTAGSCQGAQVCIHNNNTDMSNCRPRCMTTDDCPASSRCIPFTDGMGVCLAAGGEGDMCSPEFCSANTICVGQSADDAVCRRCCESMGDCDTGQNCVTLMGSNLSCMMACIPQ